MYQSRRIKKGRQHLSDISSDNNMLGFSMFSSFSTQTEIAHWGKSKAEVCTTTRVHAPPSYSWQRKHGFGISESPLGPCSFLTQLLEQKTAPRPLELLYLWLLSQSFQGHIVQEMQRILTVLCRDPPQPQLQLISITFSILRVFIMQCLSGILPLQQMIVRRLETCATLIR